MASYSGIESWLSVIAGGITGIGLRKDFGIRTPELDYFIEYCTKTPMSVSALAPSPLVRNYDELVKDAYSKLLSMLNDLQKEKVSEEILNEALDGAQRLYGLLNAVYNAVRANVIPV